MKYLKTYPIFESKKLTKKQEKFLNEYTDGTWKLNSEGLVDIEGGFNCSYNELKSLYAVRFGKVSGHFDCSWNQLTSLEGAPREVGRDFYCDHNQLISLEGAPQKVGGNFRCSDNQLTSLEGAPQKVGGNFRCSDNQLTSLEGAPREVRGGFFCYNNQLTSLDGAPLKVEGNFDCSKNQLTSLDGAPQEVGGDFICSYNQLTSLKEAPKKYKKIFWTEGDGPIFYKSPKAPSFKRVIGERSILIWDLLKGNRSDKINDFIENDPSKIDRLNFLFDMDWYTPSPYAMAIYKAWKRGL